MPAQKHLNLGYHFVFVNIFQAIFLSTRFSPTRSITIHLSIPLFRGETTETGLKDRAGRGGVKFALEIPINTCKKDNEQVYSIPYTSC